MTLRAQTLSGLRWTAGARLAAQVFTWAITLVVIRLLSPSDYGLLAMATVFVAFLAMLSELGLGAAVVQRAEIADADLRGVFGAVLAMNAGLALALVLGAPAIGAFYGEPKVVPVLRVLAAGFLVNAFAVIPDAILQRRMEFRARSLTDLASTVAGSLVTLGLALAGFGVWALVAGSLATNLLKTIAINVLARTLRWPSFGVRNIRTLLSFGGTLTAVQFLWFFFTQIDMVIAGRWLGNELAGFYAVAAHLASLPNQRIAGIVNQVAFPMFARIQHDVDAVGRHVLYGVRILCIAVFPMLWGIAVVAPELVAAVFGAKWEPAVLPLQVLGLVMPLRMINNFVPNAVQGMGRADVILRNAAVASVVAPVAFLVGASYGLTGLCLAWVAWVPIVFLYGMSNMLPVLGLGFRRLARAMFPSLGAAAVMCVAVVATRAAMPEAWIAAARLAILVGAGVLSYAAATALLNRAGMIEAWQLARSVAKREPRPAAA